MERFLSFSYKKSMLTTILPFTKILSLYNLDHICKKIYYIVLF